MTMRKPLFLAADIVATAISAAITNTIGSTAYAKGQATICPEVFATNGLPSLTTSTYSSRTLFKAIQCRRPRLPAPPFGRLRT